MTATTPWFDVDRKGLAKLMVGRSKAFVLYELLQNAWDQRVGEVKVTITSLPGRPVSEIVVEDDDPDGFSDLAHAYTLFAESEKKGNAEQRGRFNLGEKLVLALAREAAIWTTKGCVRFDAEGRHTSREKREAGSLIRVEIPLTREEHAEVCEAAFRVIGPPGIKTTVNGRELPRREPVTEFETMLPTLVANGDGVLKQRIR